MYGYTCTCTPFKAVNPLIGDKPLGHPNKDVIIIIIHNLEMIIITHVMKNIGVEPGKQVAQDCT